MEQLYFKRIKKNIMKNLSIFLLVSLISMSSMAQDITYGLQLGLGMGSLKTTSLVTYFDYEVSNEKCVKHYSLITNMGFAYSVGGSLEYGLSDNLAFESGLSFQSLSAELLTTHIQDKVTREITNSTNTISYSSLHLPVLVKYYFSGGSGPYGLGGLGIDLGMGAKIKTDEIVTEETYSSNGELLGSAEVTAASTSAKLDGFSKLRTSIIIGAGILLDAGKNGIAIDFRYSVPLTKSEMYTSDLAFDNSTEKSDIFGISEQNDIASDGYFLNDFKMGAIMVTIAYRL